MCDLFTHRLLPYCFFFFVKLLVFSSNSLFVGGQKVGHLSTESRESNRQICL